MNTNFDETNMQGDRYNMSLRSHLIQAWPIAIFSSILVIIPAGAHYYLGIEDLRFPMLVALILFSLVFVPHLLIHLRYARVSSHFSIEFRANEKEIVVECGKYTKVIRDADIERVDMVLPRSLARNEIAVYPWQLYGYAVLKLTSGEKLLVTSLVVPKLKFPYKFRNVGVRIGLYCWPPDAMPVHRAAPI